MLRITLLLIWKRKNLITLSILQNKLNIFTDVSEQYLKVLTDRICKSHLPIVDIAKRCIFAISMWSSHMWMWPTIKLCKITMWKIYSSRWWDSEVKEHELLKYLGHSEHQCSHDLIIGQWWYVFIVYFIICWIIVLHGTSMNNSVLSYTSRHVCTLITVTVTCLELLTIFVLPLIIIQWQITKTAVIELLSQCSLYAKIISVEVSHWTFAEL